MPPGFPNRQTPCTGVVYQSWEYRTGRTASEVRRRWIPAPVDAGVEGRLQNNAAVGTTCGVSPRDMCVGAAPPWNTKNFASGKSPGPQRPWEQRRFVFWRRRNQSGAGHRDGPAGRPDARHYAVQFTRNPRLIYGHVNAADSSFPQPHIACTSPFPDGRPLNFAVALPRAFKIPSFSNPSPASMR